MNYLWQILLYLLTAFLLHHGGVSIMIWPYGKEDLISLVIITLHRKLFECYQSKPTRTQLPIRKKSEISQGSNENPRKIKSLGCGWNNCCCLASNDQEFDWLPRWLNFSRSITKRSKEKTRLMHVVMLISTPCFIGGKIYTPNVRFRILYSV